MELLQHLPDQGYPPEYLLSRIRGRRSRLIADWKPLIYDSVADYLSARYQGPVKERSAEGVWRSLLREYRWVYGQMSGKLRKVFGPFFLYTELRTIFIALRHMKDKGGGRAGDLLDASLLSGKVKQILAAGDIPTVLAEIEPFFLSLSGRFAGLAGAFESGGLRSVEQKLTNTYLSVMPAARLHPILKNLFTRLIDARNIISAYKFQRLEQQAAPAFIPGGQIEQARFADIVAKDDIFGICSLVREFSGVKIEAPDPAKVEIALYHGITRFLKKEGREPFGAGPILDYLWKCSLEVMNLSILLNGKGLEREIVAAELVQ